MTSPSRSGSRRSPEPAATGRPRPRSAPGPRLDGRDQRPRPTNAPSIDTTTREVS